MRAVAMLWLAALASCSFDTEAVDPIVGTSCGHYAQSRLTTEGWATCWHDSTPGECFMSSQGACVTERARQTSWPPGTRLVQWCPLGNPGTEEHDVAPCD